MFDPYSFLIIASLLVGISYIYDIVSTRTKIPTVLLLISTGILLKLIGPFINFDVSAFEAEVHGILELLGIVGLIVIVLEAALDLNLSKEKIPIIGTSLMLAFIILVITSLGIAVIIMIFLDEPFFNSLLYAIPLSVVSSAVLIPSVHILEPRKREFLIYESTFSDIMGIMFFNFVVMRELEGHTNLEEMLLIVFSIALSFVFSYLLVYFFSRIKTNLKVFLMMALLALLYAIGKKFHISSLLIILVFGIVMNNTELFFRGPLSKLIKETYKKKVCKDFKVITAETAFVVRTFFFVTFGLSINLQNLVNLKVILIGTIIVIITYLVRYVNFRLILKTNVFPEIFLAPRGLITILLFYSIPQAYLLSSFSVGILFFVILVTGIVMMVALIKTPDTEPVNPDSINIDYQPLRNIESPEGPYCIVPDTDNEKDQE
jgi:NhaP-type Na+/H+ or K+/H+ antiporter